MLLAVTPDVAAFAWLPRMTLFALIAQYFLKFFCGRVNAIVVVRGEGGTRPAEPLVICIFIQVTGLSLPVARPFAATTTL